MLLGTDGGGGGLDNEQLLKFLISTLDSSVWLGKQVKKMYSIISLNSVLNIIQLTPDINIDTIYHIVNNKWYAIYFFEASFRLFHYDITNPCNTSNTPLLYELHTHNHEIEMLSTTNENGKGRKNKNWRDARYNKSIINLFRLIHPARPTPVLFAQITRRRKTFRCIHYLPSIAFPRAYVIQIVKSTTRGYILVWK